MFDKIKSAILRDETFSLGTKCTRQIICAHVGANHFTPLMNVSLWGESKPFISEIEVNVSKLLHCKQR